MTVRLLLALAALWALLAATTARADAWLIDIDGPIGPAVSDHMVRGLAQAEAAGAELVILRIDTPGGLDTAMRDMIKGILAAKLPVVGHVAPSGARAASAGTYLLYATHVAAMASGTNLGAATPVRIGTPGMPGPGRVPGQGEESGRSAMDAKMVNDAVAYIRGLAQLRGRNAEWAEASVREAASLTAVDALEQGVIDLIAEDTAGLLSAIDGREVTLERGVQTLTTEGLAVRVLEPDWRSEFLGVITNPNVAYILMLLGVYGLILEFYNPGFGLPGVTGAICLFLALYAFQALPVSYVGVGLILLGVALMTAEAFVPSFGVLGLGGIGAFVIGSVMLMDTDVPAYQVALPTIAAFAVFSVALLMFALGLVLRARRSPVVAGMEHLIGATGVVESVEGGEPRVRLDGELWSVRCNEPLAVRDRVTVHGVDSLTLQVNRNPAAAGE
jgi:membrane-bound serine protease (ClpP class)